MLSPSHSLRRATATDMAALNALMQKSRAYQGQYRSILEGYELAATQIEHGLVYVAEKHSQVVGFYSFIAASPSPELDLLFVSDKAQGAGIGSALIAHLKQLASSLGIDAIRIVAHPPAANFYLRMGARIIGTSPPQGRVSWERPVFILHTTAS